MVANLMPIGCVMVRLLFWSQASSYVLRVKTSSSRHIWFPKRYLRRLTLVVQGVLLT